jgi:hypothetical protein
LATLSAEAMTSPGTVGSQLSFSTTSDSSSSARVTAEAGSRRRRRRAQNAVSFTRCVRPNSTTSSEVIRKPDSVKNVETPR